MPQTACQSLEQFFHSYSVDCCGLQCFRTFEVQAFKQEPECTPLYLLNPSTNTEIYIYIDTSLTAHFSQLTNMVLTLPATFIACSGVHCGLKYKHCPMKQKLFLNQKVRLQGRTVPIQFR